MKTGISFFLLLSILSCRHTEAQIPYDLDKPAKHFELPAILNEVSGVTDLDNDHLALVQDELGVIFIFSLTTGNIEKQLPFDTTGDFEGLTYTGDALFVLRSDGRLTEWKDFDFQTGGGAMLHHQLPVDTKDNEGLAYDRQNNRLLIAAKSKPGDPDEKEARYIYAYDLSTRQLRVDDRYTINTTALAKAAKEFGVSTITWSAKGKPRPFNFRPSSIAIHPSSGEAYILSAADHMLVLLDNKGDVVAVRSLDKGMFPKAEGVTFLKDGSMIITNEADGKVATMMVWEPGEIKTGNKAYQNK